MCAKALNNVQIWAKMQKIAQKCKNLHKKLVQKPKISTAVKT